MQRGNPMELNVEDLEMQKWNIPTDRAQRVDEKKKVICLVIMFTPGYIISKIAFFVFSADDSKKSVTIRQNI